MSRFCRAPAPKLERVFDRQHFLFLNCTGPAPFPPPPTTKLGGPGLLQLRKIHFLANGEEKQLLMWKENARNMYMLYHELFIHICYTSNTSCFHVQRGSTFKIWYRGGIGGGWYDSKLDWTIDERTGCKRTMIKYSSVTDILEATYSDTRGKPNQAPPS